jgi:hypothetical protein
MGGGLLQLTIEGQMNIPLFYNPKISFFTYAYKRHTNYAMENIIHNFKNKPGSITTMHTGGTYNITLTENPNVDLLSNVYFIFKLPKIYSSDKLRFKWVENIGSLIIKDASIYIDELKVDTITGEWLVVWNELSMPVKDGYNTMTGNIPEFTNPRKKETTYRIKNNIISEYDYMASDKIKDVNNPSINERYITVPLPFWFSKNHGLSLPILKFCANRKVYLKLNFENIENLYTVYSDIYNMNISPAYYNIFNSNNKISFNDFILEGDDKFIAHVDATFIVLDCFERQTILNNSISEVIIETVKINYDKFISGGNDSIRIIDVKSQLLVKEIIWTLNRADSIDKFNNKLNYSYSIPNNNENSIMKSALISWDNNTARIEEKEAYFYNNIQPYQHHSIIPRQGIYCYSFSLFPERWFPSGCYNAAGVAAKLIIKLNNYKSSLIDVLYQNKFGENYKMGDNNNDILITLYIVQYNILIINSGDVGLRIQN